MPGLEDILVTGASTVTVPTLVHRVWDEIVEDEPWEDSITAAVLDTTTASATLGAPSSWAEGDIGEFDDDTGEQFRVTASANAANPVPIKRGHNGTTASTHPINTVVRKIGTGRHFSYKQTEAALQRIVQSELFPFVWVAKTMTVAPSLTQTVFAAPADFIDVLYATQQTTDTNTTVYRYGPTTRIVRAIDVPSTVSGTTKAIEFPQGFDNTTNDVEVLYRAVVTTSSIVDGDVADVVVTGAIARLLLGKEIPRITNSAPPSTTNVTPGVSLLRNYSAWKNEFLTKRSHLYHNLCLIVPPASRFVR